MYGHAPPKNMLNQISADENDDVSNEHSMDHIQYEKHALDDGNGAIVIVFLAFMSNAVGALRDLSKRNQEISLVPAQQVEGNNNSDCGTAIHAHNNLVTFSGNDNPDLVPGR
ncbi:hypothetical protein TanjilG_32514 [Lupinus angustifolius]|uniref:Uncharacterized protein n=1 Tax=Lupinus angustifolius TaxID=3871 RepID=A0A4P1R895_LUPAN|nr:hypothetical protein TanjilG_32514 [Lupinus angustifolius]